MACLQSGYNGKDAQGNPCGCPPNPGRCTNPVTVNFSFSRCFYPGQTLDAPTVQVTGPNGYNQSKTLTYSSGKFVGSIQVQDKDTYNYLITSASTFNHSGSFTLSNCNTLTVSDSIVSKIVRVSLPGC